MRRKRKERENVRAYVSEQEKENVSEKGMTLGWERYQSLFGYFWDSVGEISEIGLWISPCYLLLFVVEVEVVWLVLKRVLGPSS